LIYMLFASLLICLAILPAWMVGRNLRLFHRAATDGGGQLPAISVLIPARNEERAIAEAIHAIRANTGIEFEIVVMDDHSSDSTATVVNAIADQDPRVRLAVAPELPSGWNGKQHACWQLSQVARFDRLLFLDADVRLSVDGLRRLSSQYEQSGCALLSGFPDQITATVAEKMLIPMMHFVLLGYLPLDRMRASTQPEFGAGCGQMFFTSRADYEIVGGHSAIANSRHDGLQLPRSYRRVKLTTDLFDASDIASVRMYTGWASVIAGLMKNATEGLANAKLIGVFSLLLLGSAVFPILTLAHAWYHGWPWAVQAMLVFASLLSYVPRALLAIHLRQSWIGVVLHPVAVAIFVAIQWLAFVRACSGRGQVAWKGRA
jgi:hypothetical protein